MNKAIILLGLMILPLFASASAAQEDDLYFGDRERGWFWYQDPLPEPEEETEEPLQAAPLPATPEDPQALLQAYQKQLDDAKALAVMRPTDDNVRRYIEVQKEVYDRSALAESEGLFFFFSSECGHCHTQSQILEQFSRRYGVKVMAISLDGGTLPEFPGAVIDNGLAQRLGVAVTPALYMVNPRSQEITPVGFGVMTESELAQRIYTLTAAKRGQF